SLYLSLQIRQQLEATERQRSERRERLELRRQLLATSGQEGLESDPPAQLTRDRQLDRPGPTRAWDLPAQRDALRVCERPHRGHDLFRTLRFADRPRGAQNGVPIHERPLERRGLLRHLGLEISRRGG